VELEFLTQFSFLERRPKEGPQPVEEVGEHLW